MAWKKKTTIDSNTTLPTGYPAFPRISSFVKQLIKASQYEYHESEAFEVTEVLFNEIGNRGAVRGTFINNPNQEVLGGIVKPLMPNIINVPVIGEHVVVIEYNGQHYYTGIINRKGSVNENSIPGAAGNYAENTKYGETFERKDVKPLEISEGCILFEGRFGQSIHFGSEIVSKTETVDDEEVKRNEHKPLIKIVAGHRSTAENINKDDSSIYLEGGVDDADTASKKIKIKSNDIFITGKRKIELTADEIVINGKSGNTIKMGDPRAPMVPTVRGDVLLQFQSDILTFMGDLLGALSGSPLNIAKAALALPPKLLRLVDVVTNLSFLNFKVMTADPNFKLPELPEVPDLNLPKIPEVPKVKIPPALEDLEDLQNNI